MHALIGRYVCLDESFWTGCDELDSPISLRNILQKQQSTFSSVFIL